MSLKKILPIGTGIRTEKHGQNQNGRTSLAIENLETDKERTSDDLALSQMRAELANLKEQLHQEITERQRLEALVTNFGEMDSLEEQHKRTHRQNALVELGQRGILNRDLYSFFDELVATVCQTLATNFCALWELLPNHSAFVLCAAEGWDKSLVGTVTIDATARSFAGYTLKINAARANPDYQPVITQDLALETRFRGAPLLHNHEVVSGVNLIVPSPQGPFGVLGIYACQERFFSKEEINFLTVVSHILSAAIDRHHYESRLMLLERAMNASQNGVIITDALESANPIIYANQGFEKITGYSQEEAIAQHYLFFQKGHQHRTDLAKVQQAIDFGRECHITLSNLRKDGTTYWYQLSIDPVYDEWGHLVNFIAVQADITDLKRTEQALTLSEAKLRGLFEQAGVGIIQLDLAGNFVAINPGFSQMLGYSFSELVEQPFWQIYHSFQDAEGRDLQAAGEALLKDLFQQRKSSISTSQEQLCQHRDGHGIWCQLTMSAIRDEAGNPIAFLAIVIDVNERKKAEIERDRFFTLSLDLLGIADFDGYFHRINPAFIKVLGYSEAEILSQPFLNFVHPDDLDATLAEMHSLSEGKSTFYFENRYRCKDGSYRWLAWASAAGMEDGLLYAAAHDITPLKELTSELKNSQDQLHSILGSLKDMVWSFDLESQQFIYLNQVVERFYGIALEHFLANPQLWLEMVHPEDRPLAETASQQLLENGIAKDISYRIVQSNGEILWLRDRAHLIYDEKGKAIRIDGIATDITEAKKIEASLQESEDRLRRIITTISDGLLVVDLQGTIKFVNQAATQLFGRSPSELLEDQIGIPLVGNNPIEITLHHRDGLSIVAEMRIVQITWEGTTAYLISLQDITERYTSAQALAKSEEKYRRIVELTTEGIWVLDQNKQIIFVNQQLSMMLGYSVEELLNQDIFDFVDVTHEPRDIRRPFPTCALPQGSEVHDFKFHRRDGTEIWAMVSKSSFFDEEGNYTGELAMLTDITERKAIEQALFESEQRLEGILGSIQDVVWSTAVEPPLPLYLNSATELVYERLLSDFYEQPNLWFELIHPEDRILMRSSQRLLIEKGSTEVEYRIVRPSGEVRWLFRRAKVVYNVQGEPIRIDGIDSDVTERKLAAERLHFNATHDSLTGLPNRFLFLDRLGHALQQNSRRPNYCFAVLFLDLDGFKTINDSLGHAYGDLLLQEIAQRLQKCLRPNDTLARLGGDEFTMLIEDIRGVQDAIAVAQRVHEQLNYAFNLESQEIFTNTSVGIAMSSSYYRHPQDMLRDADTAMYQAKAGGKSCYRIFDHTMHKQVVVRLQRENDLRRALDRQEFQIYYQPIVTLKTGKLIGLEALIRWHHPDDGQVLPQDFIAIAEETGLIVPIGRWVLEESCRQIRMVQENFPCYQSLKISVNISSRQIRAQNLLQDIDSILAKTGLDPKTLKLEITESILMDNLEVATEVLLALRKRQVEICLDDFGTGYSSLSYLHRFPINTLKIDRSFVMPMQPNDENSEIVRTIITLAHTLGLDVIAEGIENDMQLTQLRWLGCEQGQGYYFARPMSYESLLEIIKTSEENNIWKPIL